MALLGYDTTNSTVLGGLDWQPIDRFEVGFDAVLSEGDASMDPFGFDLLSEYPNNPNQSFDFTQAHLNSDLDFTHVELGLRLSYRIRDAFAVSGGYRYLDYDDDAPYLVDTSGKVELYRLGVSWIF